MKTKTTPHHPKVLTTECPQCGKVQTYPLNEDGTLPDNTSIIGCNHDGPILKIPDRLREKLEKLHADYLFNRFFLMTVRGSSFEEHEKRIEELENKFEDQLLTLFREWALECERSLTEEKIAEAIGHHYHNDEDNVLYKAARSVLRTVKQEIREEIKQHE